MVDLNLRLCTQPIPINLLDIKIKFNYAGKYLKFK